MTSHKGEEHFPYPADDVGNHDNRQHHTGTANNIGHEGCTFNIVVDVEEVAGVPDAEEQAGQEGIDYKNHQTFLIDGVADVRCARRNITGRSGKRIAGFEQRIKPFELSAFFKKWSDVLIHKVE